MKHLLPLMTLTLSAQLACTGPVTQNGAVQTSNKKPAVSKAGISDGEEDATNKNSDSSATEESEESEDGLGHDHSHSAATDESTSTGANGTAPNQAAPVTTNTPPPASTVQNGNIVEFHIKAGTGNGPWNDEASRINVKVGQELHIINDDDRTHLMHTNGAPFFHPFIPIAAGGKAVYKIASPLPNGTLYDHQTKGKIYINAER